MNKDNENSTKKFECRSIKTFSVNDATVYSKFSHCCGKIELIFYSRSSLHLLTRATLFLGFPLELNTLRYIGEESKLNKQSPWILYSFYVCVKQLKTTTVCYYLSIKFLDYTPSHRLVLTNLTFVPNKLGRFLWVYIKRVQV